MNGLTQTIVFSCCAAFATAATGAENGVKAVPVAADFAQISSLLGSLVFILCLILICAWLVKRVSGVSHAGSQHLRVLGALSIGSKERAVLVSAGQTQLLLGVASGSVSLLHVFDKPVVSAEELAAASNFASTLKQLTGQRNVDPAAQRSQ